jgi:hypothetical protein
VDKLSVPFSIYLQNLANATPQPVRWLWQERLPLAGITLLDGDHDCGKSLLALEIAARVSSGSPMPDGTPTIQGGVVIISSPKTDATTTQFQRLTALGADLSRIRILSYVPESVPAPDTGGFRPFSLPEDFPHLFAAIEEVDARLVIFDPFMTDCLSRCNCCNNSRLSTNGLVYAAGQILAGTRHGMDWGSLVPSAVRITTCAEKIVSRTRSSHSGRATFLSTHCLMAV